ncbi:phosphatase PAP2 family protein, partial [Vibrio parahaemolyticus]|nr:phosphatase PAP2 family protein [Vibrio parahaemolyticus]
EKFDNYFFSIFNNKIKNSYFDKTMIYITNMGGAISNTIISFILIFLGNNKIKLIGIELLIALFFSQIIVQFLKRTLGRKRPYKVLDNLNTYGIEMKDYSFPSGHTTASFCLATVFSLNIPYLSVVFFIFAGLVGISRIYLGVHYPSDVLAGIILGIISSFIVHYNFQWAVEAINNILAMINL